MVDTLEVLEVDSQGATIIEVETEVIHEFLPDKVAEDVIEVLGTIIVALETETLDDTFLDKLAGEKRPNNWAWNLSEQSPRHLTTHWLTR